MLKGVPPKYRNGECSGCGGEQDRKPERICRKCHAEREKNRRLSKKLIELAKAASSGA